LEGLINANAGAIGDNDADIAELVASVDSIEVVDGQQNQSIDSLETAISNILDIPGTDLDQFSEMVSFVQSVDTVNDGLLSDFIGVANASVDSLETVASTAIDERGDLVASIDSLEALSSAGTGALEASVDSLEDIDAGLADDIQTVANDLSDYTSWTNASVDSLEVVDTALSNAIDQNSSDISDNGTAIGDLQASVDSLEVAEDNAIASIDSLETVDNALAIADTRLHQFGTFVNPTRFQVALAVDVAATADTLVFINGHNIHVESEGIDGWSSLDGLTFNLANIGYDIDAEDHIYVVAPRG
jgi:ABC-type transporter Mla subunit MlaD